MGFMVGSLEWLNYFDKKRCKSLFFRVRAKLKKALKHGGHKKQLRFQYDPSSYALNFDDGCFSHNFEDGTNKNTSLRETPVLGFYSDVNNNTTWVYVVVWGPILGH